MSLLEVNDLRIEFSTPDGVVTAVDGVNFALERGGSLAIAGESGSGKSQTALAIMGLLPANAKLSGSIRLDGQEMTVMAESELNHLRGSRVAMIFQDPSSALNPYMRVGRQIAEVIEQHQRVDSREATLRAAALLDKVGIDNPGNRARHYPHQFSGGQRQRIMIAIAMACGPDLLLADEPTTALDVTVQRQILDLLGELRAELGAAIIMISHDIAILSGACRDLLVMYAGKPMEFGPMASMLNRPAHPYTAALLKTLADLHAGDGELSTIPGEVPAPGHTPPGCVFHPRCTSAFRPCDTQVPEWRESEPPHAVACHLVDAP